MADLTKMLNEIKKLLIVENKLEDLIGYFQLNDVITINDGKKTKQYIVKNKPIKVEGKMGIPVVDEQNNTFLIQMDSYDGNSINIYKVDPKDKKIRLVVPNDILGLAVTLPKYGINTKNIDDLNIDDLNINSTDEPNEPNAPNDYDEDPIFDKFDEFKDKLKNLKIGDVLALYSYIPKEAEEGEDEYGEEEFEAKTEIYFEVKNVNDDGKLQLLFSSANGDEAGKYTEKLQDEDILGSVIDSLEILRKRIVFSVSLGKGEMFKIDYIESIQINENSVGTPTMSSIAFSEKIRGHEGFRDLYRKKESVLDTLLGRSPVGIYQMFTQLNKDRLKNSYFTKGKVVQFRLKSKSVTAPNGWIIEKDRQKTYKATIISPTQFRMLGHRNQEHWNIEVLAELEDMKFEVNIAFHRNLNDSNAPVKSIIEVIDISK